MPELKHGIVKVKTLLQLDNLKIPDYQRPYKWNIKNVNQLIDDIIFFKEKSAYRIGTVVMHKDTDQKLNIVDGQQRSITLTLIAFALKAHEQKADSLKKIKDFDFEKLPDFEFSNEESKKNILSNYQEIVRRVNQSEFDEKVIDFFFNKCEVVEVIITDVSEAFQFFDSQNARGKDLEPHDLLKAFHLREMLHLPTKEQTKSVEAWEKIKTLELVDVFGTYLFRIRNWSKGNSARYFTKNDVDLFKGISLNNLEVFPYAQLFRISHFYTENYNKEYHRSIDLHKLEYPFQIDQVIVNGKRFFEMVIHYKEMIDEITNWETSPLSEDKNETGIFEKLERYDGRVRTGDKYVRTLFNCALIYFCDKFGMKNLTQPVIDKIFIWAYSLRLKSYAVQMASIDNYALALDTKFFKTMKESINPREIMNINLETINKNESSKTEEIVELFKKLNYFDGK